MIIAAKGGTLADIIVGDVLELLDIETSVLAGWPGDGPVLYQMLHELGIFDDQAPARLRELAHRRPEDPRRTDRPVPASNAGPSATCSWTTCGNASPDWTTTAWALAYYLGKRFWKDLELHHPGIAACTCPPRSPAPGGSAC